MYDLFNKKQKTIFFVLGSIIFILVVLFVGQKLFSIFGTGGRFLGVVVWKAKSSVETNAEYARLILHSRKNLINEILSLRSTVANQTVQDSLITSLQNEITDLKKVLNHPVGSKYILASILSRPPQSLYDTFVIDRGANDGVTINDVVIADGVFVVGIIEGVDPKTSLVKLFSSPGVSYDAYIPDIGTNIRITGIGNGSFIADVPRDFPIEVGMRVLKSGTESQSFGIVASVDADPRDPTKRVLIDGPINIQHIRFIGVEIANQV